MEPSYKGEGGGVGPGLDGDWGEVVLWADEGGREVFFFQG